MRFARHLLCFAFMTRKFLASKSSYILMGLAALVTICVIGCASPAHRAKKSPDAFAALQEEWKALVLKGEIVAGMDVAGVLIAMGKPTWESPSNFMGREVMGWVYTRIESYNVPNYEYSITTGANGALFVNEHYLPSHHIKRVPAIVVFIENDKVLGWQDLDNRHRR